jgi:hypothetical protein
MKRRILPWVLAAPLMVAGSMSAHALGSFLFAAAAPVERADTDLHLEVVGRTTSGPSTQMPLLVGLIVAFALAWFCRRAFVGGRGRGAGHVSPAWFLLLPPLAFIAQEAVERLIHAESFPFNPVHEPAFLGALALQLPFGLVAFLVARLLLKVADALRQVLSGRPEHAVSRGAIELPPLRRADRRTSVSLREGRSSRGPPVLAS